jgi:hypothetical protein
LAVGGVNENFATAAIEGALKMTRDSIDLRSLQVAVAESGACILPAECSVWRAARVVSKNWWHSYGYDYVIAAIHVKHEEVLVYS